MWYESQDLLDFSKAVKMSTVLVKIPIDDNAEKCIEVEIESRLLDDSVHLASDGGPEALMQPLTSSLSNLLPAIDVILQKLRGAIKTPDEITMELGLGFGGEAGFFFARGTAQANLGLTITWRRPSEWSD